MGLLPTRLNKIVEQLKIEIRRKKFTKTKSAKTMTEKTTMKKRTMTKTTKITLVYVLFFRFFLDFVFDFDIISTPKENFV